MNRRRLGVVALAGALVLLAVACNPAFPEGATITAVSDRALTHLTWTATNPDNDRPLVEYRIDVDGVELVRVPASVTDCVLFGLPPAATVEVSVTGYNTAGEWSGNNTENGRLIVEHTTPAHAPVAGVVACVPPADSDGDRLPDAMETDTGSFNGISDTGTDPAAWDTDGDDISDGDEVLGTTAGLDLPTMGANPLRKDLIFEFDWFDDNADPGICGPHSHQPTPAIIDRLSDAFAAGPVPNPDGSTGVNVIADYGQGGVFTGGNLVADADGVIAGGVGGTDYNAIKAANLAANRQGYVHYTLMPHRYNTNSGSSGQAFVPGDDLIVSLYCYGSTNNVANTIMHEVGHNLYLGHGGHPSDSLNYKPNYNSVMNYEFQFPGVDTNCIPGGDGPLDFSTGSRASLNESALLETDGICNGVDVDWNANSVIDAGPIGRDINNGDGLFSTLNDYDDWANLYFAGIAPGAGAGAAVEEQQVITDQPVPVWAQQVPEG